MEEFVWNFLINTFLVATKDSYRLALRIAKYHNDNLFVDIADPNIQAQYTLFNPTYVFLQKSYDLWHAKGGTQTGESVNLKLILKELSGTKIQDWDIEIQAVYKQKTGDYKKLLPYHRTPFQSGKPADRLTALNMLCTNLDGIVKLSGLLVEVSAFTANFKNIFDIQQQSIITTGSFSETVEAARIEMCECMFGNYGRLLGFNQKSPKLIAKYFPLKYIQNNHQVVFLHVIAPLKEYNVVKHTFKPGDQLLITSYSAASFRVFVGYAKDEDSTGKGIVQLANTHSIIEATALGNIAEDLYLTVVNLDKNIDADFEIEFL